MTSIPAALAVHSVKGGVGKSTIAVNLAVSFAGMGLRVGLLDADITGPSIAQMLGNENTPLDQIATAHGICFASLGGVGERPIIHRGALVDRRIRGFLTEMEWGTLDLLVVDLPPGSGDAVLAASANLDLTGAVIVTSPQELSLNDTIRGLHAFGELKTPLLGLIENMSHFQCPGCQSVSYPFGESITETLCETMEIPLLARLPLDQEVVKSGDSGTPAVLNPNSEAGRDLTAIATALLPSLQLEGAVK